MAPPYLLSGKVYSKDPEFDLKGIGNQPKLVYLSQVSQLNIMSCLK